METERRVAVVGGGPAGLAAAWRLAESGRLVTLYEARDVVGGRLRTEQVAGVAADAGVQLLSAGYTETLELARRLGAQDLLVPAPGRDALWRGGRAHALRYGSVSSMAVSSALPAGAKLRLLKYVPFLERHAGVLDLNDPSRAAAAGLDGESIGEWGRRKVGDDFVELLVYPLLAAYYGVTPEETSAALFHALARAGMGVQVLAVRGGMSALAHRLSTSLAERGVRFELSTSVTAVDAVPEAAGPVDPTADDHPAAGPGATPTDRRTSAVRIRLASGESVLHSGAVVAVPAEAARTLLPDAALAGNIRVRRAAVLVVALSRPVPADWFGLSFPRTESPGETVAALCSHAAKGAGLVPEGRGSITVIPAPAVAAEWAEATPRPVLEAALPVLERVMPGVGASISEARLVRLGAGGWVPEPGHFDRLAGSDVDEGVPPGIALAGDYLVAPTVEGAVRSGLRAAGRLSFSGS